MDAIREILNVDFVVVIVGILIIMYCFNGIVTIIGKFSNVIGKPVKWYKGKNVDHDLLLKTITEVSELQRKQKEDMDINMADNQRIRNDIAKLSNMIESYHQSENKRTIAMFRSTLYRIHKEVMEQGYISTECLKTFTECGKIYEEAGGDDIYHDKLHPEVMSLAIRDE